MKMRLPTALGAPLSTCTPRPSTMLTSPRLRIWIGSEDWSVAQPELSLLVLLVGGGGPTHAGDGRRGADERGVGQGGAGGGRQQAHGDERADERAANGAHASLPSITPSPSDSTGAVRRRRYTTAPYVKTNAALTISPNVSVVWCGIDLAL